MNSMGITFTVYVWVYVCVNKNGDCIVYVSCEVKKVEGEGVFVECRLERGRLKREGLGVPGGGGSYSGK